MIVAVLLAAAAAAPTSEAVDLTSRQGEAGKVFPYIEHFLKMPAAEHTAFTVAYYFRGNGEPTGEAGAVLMDGDARIPLPVAADGRFALLPTLDQVRSHDLVTFNVPEKTRIKIRIGLAPIAPPASSMDAATVAKAVYQANSAIHHLVGPFSVAVPRMRMALFDGASGGMAVLADGAVTPLPTNRDGPYYEPSKLKNAVTLTFTRVAGHIDIQP